MSLKLFDTHRETTSVYSRPCRNCNIFSSKEHCTCIIKTISIAIIYQNSVDSYKAVPSQFMYHLNAGAVLIHCWRGECEV